MGGPCLNIQVEDEDTEEALRLADIVLRAEPDNAMVQEYKVALGQLQAQEGE